jgi:hypothetical protein
MMSGSREPGIGSGQESSMRFPVALLLMFLAGCDLRGLTHAQLYGPGPADAESTPPELPRDAGVLPMADAAPSADAATPAPPPDGPPAAPDLAPIELITITGTVSSNCGGVNANVGALGRHTCSHQGKGNYTLRVAERPGRTITISAQREGHTPFPYSARILLDANGTNHDIVLHFDGPCTAAAELPPCVCQPVEQCGPS